MRAVALTLAFCAAACGANASAIKTAEEKCLSADLASLEQKIAAGLTEASAEAAAISLTTGELVCAVEALSAKAPVGSGSAK